MDTTEGTQGASTETPGAKTAVEPLAVRKAAILAKLTGGGGTAAATVGDDDTADLTDPKVAAAGAAKPKTPEPPADGEHTTRIADLSKQVRDLTDQLTATKAKVPAEDKYAALIERLKSDPAALLDEFSEHGVTLEKISESYLAKQNNPAHGELTAQQKEIADLKARLDAKEKAEKDAQAKTATEQAESAGRTAVTEMVTADKARWPIATAHADNTAEAVADAIAAARLVGKALGRTPTAAEAEKIMGDCLDEVEKTLTAKGARYRKPDIAPAAPARRTIAAPAGGTAGGPAATAAAPPKSLSERKAAIIANARRAAQPKS